MSYLLPLVNIHDKLTLHNCSYGMLHLSAVMSCLCTKAPRVVSPQSSLLNYLYLLHFHIMAVLKSNKQSKAYTKGRGQGGAGTFFLPLLNTRKGQASHIKSTEFGSQESLRGPAQRSHQRVWRLPPWWGFNQLCGPVWLWICHAETYGGMQTFIPPLPKYVCENSFQKIQFSSPLLSEWYHRGQKLVCCYCHPLRWQRGPGFFLNGCIHHPHWTFGLPLQNLRPWDSQSQSQPVLL